MIINGKIVAVSIDNPLNMNGNNYRNSAKKFLLNNLIIEICRIRDIINIQIIRGFIMSYSPALGRTISNTKMRTRELEKL